MRVLITRGVVLLAALVAGCAMNLPQVEEGALPAAPAAFKEAQGRWTLAPAAQAQPRGEWWKAFADPVLDDLVARANRSNADIKVAAARLVQARAIVRATDAARYPQIGIGGSAARTRGIAGGNPGPAGNIFELGADVGYEVDVFGRLSQATQAAELDADARASLFLSTRLLVQAEVAQTYLALRALDAEIALVRSTVGAYRTTLELTERRWRAGDVAELDVARARVEAAETESEALALERRRSELEHALAVLIGETPSEFGLASADWNTALPSIPAGVPGTVLVRRPDVAAAQSEMLAAQARVGVAQAAWFPNVTLTASGGVASGDLSDLLKWSARSWLLGGLLALPIFDGGRRQAGIDSAGAEFEAAVGRYRSQILTAIKDVEDQLAALRLLAEQSGVQQEAVDSARRATALSEVRYRNGYVSQLDWLDAQRSELRNRRQALQVRSSQYQATVGLVRALGGGWAVD
jgi:multidrug efflux system outer membrane protein